jgi:small subunit ribosomal protein S16
MAVHIRLSRAGAKKRPFYRIIVADHRSPRGGRFLENIGTYDPTREPVHLEIDTARLTYWRANGALPSATVGHLIKRHAKIASEGASPAAPGSAKEPALSASHRASADQAK